MAIATVIAHRYVEIFRIGLNEALSPVTDYVVEQSGHEVDWGSVISASLRFSQDHLLSLRTLMTHAAEDQTRTWEGDNADRNTIYRSARLQFVERQLFFRTTSWHTRIQLW